MQALLAQLGAIRPRDHPQLTWAFRSGVAAGWLVRILPGVVVPAARADDPDVRIMAGALWRPGAILLGRAAARLSFDPRIGVGIVHMTGHRGTDRPGFRVIEARVDPRYVRFRQSIAFTDASLTVVDLLRDGDVDPLYDALRGRFVTLGSLQRALAAHPDRAGNEAVRQQLWRARENPWSHGEAELHDYLRRFGIQGWKGNVRVQLRDCVYYVDALFRRERLALELAGVEHHTSVVDREYDYRRRALLMAEGYRVLGLTLGMIRTDPQGMAARITAARTITRSPDLQGSGRLLSRNG